MNTSTSHRFAAPTDTSPRTFRWPRGCPHWLALSAAIVQLAALPLHAQDGFNILANDNDNDFKPKIVFSESNGDRIHVVRDDGSVSYEVLARAGRISACVVGNLVEFPFSEISEDMPISVSIGGFSFGATLGEDHSRRVDRDGNLLPFNPGKKSAIYYFQMEVPPTTDTGESTFRRVGYVRFSWDTKTVTARVVVSNVDGAGVGGIYERQGLLDLAEIDPERGGVRGFKNEPVEVSLTFGSAAGSRFATGDGRVQTLYRKVGSEGAGNSDVLQLDSLVAIGGADVKAADVNADVPALDEDANGLISFNGTLTDLAPSTLSETFYPVAFQLFLDGTEMLSDLDTGDPALADYIFSITDPDRNGKCIFTVTDLNLPGVGAQHSLVIQAVDASGNVRKVETQVADSNLTN